MKIRSLFMTVPLLAANVFSGALPQVVNHWVANTYGGEKHVQNFLEDMVVWYPTDKQFPSPLVLTKSFWDEGHCGICAYHNGAQYGKAEWWASLIDSRTATRPGKTCRIRNFYGRAFLGKIGPPPVGELAPYIACDGNDTIRTIVDPTALAFDMKGRLLVTDNGPDQNIKIFELGSRTPVLFRTFGEPGGVFAGPVTGAAGVRRFWGPRGLGVDSAGNIYVGTTGLPMQVGGGTDIRVYSASDSSLLWQVQGLSFVNSADADPVSAGKSVFLNAERYDMDLNLAPGKSWKLAAATIDPFRFPDDPRLSNSFESVFARRINGKLFLYMTDMYNSMAAVVRFEPGSEIGIPTAFFCLSASGQTPGFWGEGKHPTWATTEENKLRRWMWRDRNGNGQVEPDEFSEFNLAFTYNLAFDVDDRGDLWYGGQGKWDPQFRIGGLLHIRAGSLDAQGVPRFAMAENSIEPIPFTDNNGYLFRMKYMSDKDVMYLTSGTKYPYSSHLWRVDHWSDTTRRVMNDAAMPYDDLGQPEIHLDQNSADMTLPMSFTADSQYIYIAYIDKGPATRKRGEITVINAKTGANVGYIVPGPETDSLSGAIDLPNGINVRVLPDGSRVIYVEEDGQGKVMVYHWKPTTTIPSGLTAKDATPAKSFWVGGDLLLTGTGWSQAVLHDASGRLLARWNLASLSPVRGGLLLPMNGLSPKGATYLSLVGPLGQRSGQAMPPRF